MTMNTRSTVVGVFHTRNAAEDALRQLRNAGFSDDQTGFVARDSDRMDERTDMTDADPAVGAGAGAVTGAVTGGLVAATASLLIPGVGPIMAGGILAATLGGAAIGAATGGIAAALMDMGVTEDEARYYHGEFESGRTLVTVRAAGRSNEAATIMRGCGAYDIEARGTTAAA